MKCEAIHRNLGRHSICEMCKALGMDKSTYYKWMLRRERQKSRLEKERLLIEKVTEVFIENKKVYGYRKMNEALLDKDIEISMYKIRKIMKQNGLYPEIVHKFKPYPKAKSDGRYSENILNQKFDCEKPDQIWTGDITYIKTSLGWVYLSVVMDLYNREIVGYSVSKDVGTELVKRSLSDAIARVDNSEGLMFHSDRGVQYSSKSFSGMLRDYGIVSSMSRSGCPYDNSCVERFFSSLKRECIYRKRYSTMEEVEKDIFEYIELFYNRKRLHSSLGYLSPIDYRIKQREQLLAS